MKPPLKEVAAGFDSSESGGTPGAKLAVACLDALEDWVVDWMRAKGFDFVDVGYAEAKNLGVNLVALGNDRVLSMKGSTGLNEKMRALGFEVYDPDMSMFTLGGGGVHCLCQALRRDPVE